MNRETFLNIQKYIEKGKEIQTILINFLNEEVIDENIFLILCNTLKEYKIVENAEYLKEFLYLLLKISNNCHRIDNYYIRIEKILQCLEITIKNAFSNIEIFNIFKSNKLIILYLIKQKIIILDQSIILFMTSMNKSYQYYNFLLPEIRSIANEETLEKIEDEIIEFDPIIFDKKRQIGENDSYICTLIRNDSINEFISYVNRTNLPLTSSIKPSIFETNSILLKKNPTLIEYASFFGSIQIFQYLRFNKVFLDSSLWNYTIHSKNAELIHLLEENHVDPPGNSYVNCFEEAIKCHHDDIAEYIKNCLISNNDIEKYNDNIIDCCLRYHNFKYLPKNENLCQSFVFYYLCKYKYSNLVNLFMKLKENEIIGATIQTFYIC